MLQRYKFTSLSTARARLFVFIVLVATGDFLCLQAQGTLPKNSPRVTEPAATQTYTDGGISVDFNIEPVSSRTVKGAELLAGTEALVRFRIHDAGNQSLSNLHPSVWLNKR